ncbi:MAG: NUDIX hydrolase [Thermodesulfobacteriota bacterium]
MDSTSKERDLAWELVDSREDRSYALFSVAVQRSKSPRTGKVHEFQVINSPSWVTVIPVTPDDRVVMVRQFRHGSRELSLEPPGGLVKDGQSPEQSAWEELEEETGYKGSSLELLGWMYPMPALFTNRFYVYLARNVVPSGRKNPDETEEVETVLVPVDEIRDHIRGGEIQCAVMISALHLFLDRVGK